MTRYPMRPETVARRARERIAEQAADHAALLERMADAATVRGPGDAGRASFYADMLADHRATCARCDG